MRPAQAVGAEFEPGLVAEIVADVASQPGALPMMQYALTELFDARISGMLMVNSYRDLGGLSGALARRADELFASLDAPAQAAARRVFGRLVTLGEGSEDTRRRVRQSELGNEPAVDTVVDVFGSARLLAFDRDSATREPTVEVAHEALIREWPRLRGWLDDDRDGLRVERAVTDATAVGWQSAARTQTCCAAAVSRLRWSIEPITTISSMPTSVRSSMPLLPLRDDEAARTKRTNRRLRRLAVAVSVVAILALIAGAVALVQQNRAGKAADEAEAQTLVAEAQTQVAEAQTIAATQSAELADLERLRAQAAATVQLNTPLAALLAVESYNIDPSPASADALNKVLVGAGGRRASMSTPEGEYADGISALGADGTFVAMGDPGRVPMLSTCGTSSRERCGTACRWTPASVSRCRRTDNLLPRPKRQRHGSSAPSPATCSPNSQGCTTGLTAACSSRRRGPNWRR